MFSALMGLSSRAGDARAVVVGDLSLSAAVRAVAPQVELRAHLMSDEAKAFVAIGENFAAHETVNHYNREYVRNAVHVNSVEGFTARIRRTVAGVFHHISPKLADPEVSTCISMKSVSAGPSASSQVRPCGKAEAASRV